MCSTAKFDLVRSLGADHVIDHTTEDFADRAHRYCKGRAADLERLTELIEAGNLTPSVDRTCPLDQVAEAMRHLAAGKARGKIAIPT